MTYLQRLVDRATGAAPALAVRPSAEFPPPRPILGQAPTPVSRRLVPADVPAPEQVADDREAVAESARDVEPKGTVAAPMTRDHDASIVRAVRDAEALDELQREASDRVEDVGSVTVRPEDVSVESFEPVRMREVQFTSASDAAHEEPSEVPGHEDGDVVVRPAGEVPSAHPSSQGQASNRPSSSALVIGRPAPEPAAANQLGTLAPTMATPTASPAAAREPGITPVDVVIDTIEIVSDGGSSPAEPPRQRTIGFADYQSLRAYVWEG